MGLKETFTKRGFQFEEFTCGEAAVSYLCTQCAGHTVAFGGSVTAQELDLYNCIGSVADCSWHWKQDLPDAVTAAEYYITSANAISKTGEIVNIDGNGNRVSSTIYGRKHVFFVVGENKLTEDLPAALDRARNVAAPLNAKRLKRNTPCAADGRCHDCQSPECICSVISILRRKPSSCNATVVFIRESLGY